MFAVSIQTFFTLDLLSLTHLLVNWEMAVVFFFFFFYRMVAIAIFSDQDNCTHFVC